MFTMEMAVVATPLVFVTMVVTITSMTVLWDDHGGGLGDGARDYEKTVVLQCWVPGYWWIR